MRISKGKYIAFIAALAVNSAFAQPRTFLGPIAHLGVVKSITDNSAFALAGEAGPKNLRASGTIGWEFDYNQRMKATAEYLTQKLTYGFSTGQQSEWMGQSAIGANYQYDFRQVDPFNTLLDLSAYYSHSPSKGLGATTTSGGTTYNQRIAGANAFGVAPGISLASLYGTTAGVELNYDNVHYNTKNRSALTVKGLGGTVRLGQAITDDVSVGASAAIRQPYNDYDANIRFGNVDFYGLWSLNAFGGYTIGKSTLPSSYNVGLGADYFIDAHNNDELPKVQQSSKPMPQQKYKDYKDYKDMPPLVWQDPEIVDMDFLNWVSVPAVKIPNVYTVPDERCVAPRFVGAIPNKHVTTATYSIDLADFFQENPNAFVFSVKRNGVTYDSSDYTIVGTTLTFINSGSVNDGSFVVTASDGCGSASSNSFSLTFD